MNQPTEAMAFRMREARILAEMEADLDPYVGPEPEIVVGDSPLSHLDMIHRGDDFPKDWKLPAELLDSDPFDDDTPLVCGIENPDTCESCQ